jgi:hypothetical protein
VTRYFLPPESNSERAGISKNAGLARKHWKDAAAIRRIFKDAFERAGLPYFNPHSFRNTLTSLGERICPTPEAFKAWSQNLGHAHVLTTFTSYGTVAQHRQDEIMTQLANGAPPAAAQPPTLVVVETDRLERMERMISNLGSRNRDS